VKIPIAAPRLNVHGQPATHPARQRLVGDRIGRTRVSEQKRKHHDHALDIGQTESADAAVLHSIMERVDLTLSPVDGTPRRA
jgi:hypothetical protein